MSERAKCLKCIHYFSTYNPQTPRGCRLYNIQTKGMPSTVIQQETGGYCHGYKSKEHFKDSKKKTIDLNDPRNW
jgi:hypothetical protein